LQQLTIDEDERLKPFAAKILRELVPVYEAGLMTSPELLAFCENLGSLPEERQTVA
jgi:hypothetical protein